MSASRDKAGSVNTPMNGMYFLKVTISVKRLPCEKYLITKITDACAGEAVGIGQNIDFL